MSEKNNQRVLADNLMWIGDYKTAYKYYEGIFSNQKELVNVEDYYSCYNLIICSIYINKDYDKYKKMLNNVHKIYKDKIKNIQLELGELKKRIKEFENFESVVSLYDKYFDDDTSFLYLLSPRSIVTNLNQLKNKKKQLVLPEIIEKGIFKYTIINGFNSLLVKAYTEFHIDLEKIKLTNDIAVIKKFSDVVYLYFEELNLIASIFENGRVMAHYLYQKIDDKMAEKSISIFLEKLNDLLIKIN